MNIQEYIKATSLKKAIVLKNYFVGMEDRLFHTEDDHHIKNLFKTNKKHTREIVYMVVYYIAAFLSIAVITLILYGKPLAIVFMLLFSPLYIKPIVHFFALENKTKKKNIEIYKSFYNGTSIDTSVFNDNSPLKGFLVLLIPPIIIFSLMAYNSNENDLNVNKIENTSNKKETVVSNKKHINKTKQKNIIVEEKIIEEEKNILLTISVDNLRVRTSPNLDAEKIENLAIGSEVEFVEKSTNQSTVTIKNNEITEYWYKIKTPSGKIGWIHGCCFDK
jgi:hypothetical protein